MFKVCFKWSFGWFLKATEIGCLLGFLVGPVILALKAFLLVFEALLVSLATFERACFELKIRQAPKDKKRGPK